MKKKLINVSDMMAYNTKFTIQGDEIIIKRYSEYSIKGYKQSPKHKKKKLVKKFNKLFKSSDYKLIPFDLPVITEADIAKLEEKQRENFKKSVRRANKKIYELMACNGGQWQLDNQDHKMKFMTLTFDNLIYPRNKQRMIVCGPPEFIKMSDVKRANVELTKFIKRLSYYHTGRNTNDLKYIAIPELQKRGAWHFHIIFFNLPYTEWNDLVHVRQVYNEKKEEMEERGALWGMGTVGIEAVEHDEDKEGNTGKIASYVTKYLSKSYEVKEDGKIDRDLDKEKDLADFDNYKELGLHNMKRYSASKGLFKASHYFLSMNDDEYFDILNIIYDGEKNKPMNKDGDTFKVFSYYNKFRGVIEELVQRKSRQYIEGLKKFLWSYQGTCIPRQIDFVKWLELKDIKDLMKHALSRKRFDELQEIEYTVIGSYCA